tara:strand:+ start:1264 stop:1806 length:543 start_codon:yes stop_codon:yes gene_type:complete
MDIFALFGLKQQQAPKSDPASEDMLCKISNTLDQLSETETKFIASFAYILGRVAHADLEISEQETQRMEHILQERGGLLKEQATLIVQIAKTQNYLFGSTKNFIITREFAHIATHSQKLDLLCCLFSVCSSDHAISTIEDNEIRGVTREIGLSHNDFIATRGKYIEHLTVLKKNPKSLSS